MKRKYIFSTVPTVFILKICIIGLAQLKPVLFKGQLCLLFGSPINLVSFVS